MKIIVENLGKKFRNEWIFRNFNYKFQIGNTYAITGSNGSGKSTLLQVISSYIPSNEGVISYFEPGNTPVESENIYQYISYTSPILELIEDFTLTEVISFHINLKPFINQISVDNFIENIGFTHHAQKQLKFFSSGMKQKVKLGLCLFSQGSILFLDEPTTNLDETTKNWFIREINLIKQNKLIILASNDAFEYSFANEIIDIQQFKK